MKDTEEKIKEDKKKICDAIIRDLQAAANKRWGQK